MNEIQTRTGKSTGELFGRWGGIHSYAEGGLHSYAQGGERRQAQIGNGRNRIWWDEPETGGEAYIPRLGNKARNLETLATAAGWSGMDLVPRQGHAMRPSFGAQPPSPTLHPMRPAGPQWAPSSSAGQHGADGGSGGNTKSIGTVNYYGRERGPQAFRRDLAKVLR